MTDKKYTRDFSKNIGDGQTIKAETADCSALAGTPTYLYDLILLHPLAGIPVHITELQTPGKNIFYRVLFPGYLY